MILLSELFISKFISILVHVYFYVQRILKIIYLIIKSFQVIFFAGQIPTGNILEANLNQIGSFAMLIPTSKTLVYEQVQKKQKFIQNSAFIKNNSYLVTNSGLNANAKETIESLNTIKIDFSKMTKISPFSANSGGMCTRCSCGAILTKQDQSIVQTKTNKKSQQVILFSSSFPSKSSIESSQKSIPELKIQNEAQPEQKAKPQSYTYQWYCRYCKALNQSESVYFVGNGFKTILEKNISRTLMPPILIFVIDLSGSMGESISVQIDQTKQKDSKNSKQNNLFHASKQILQIIKSSIFNQKQSYKQQQLKQKYFYPKSHKNDKTSNTSFPSQSPSASHSASGSNFKYYSKITLFMAFIQNYLQKIRREQNDKNGKQNFNIFSQFRIGFIFFNQSLFVLKPNKQKLIPVFVNSHNKMGFGKDYPFEKNFINFYNYQQLFNAGKKFQRFFGDSRIKNLDLSKLMVQNLDTQGQTALGPALALALGITSVHDIGSRIVIISDSDPNLGILSPQTQLSNEQAYFKIQNYLQQRQVTLTLLTWLTDSSKTYYERQKTQFSKFIMSNPDKIKQIVLDFSLRMGHAQILNTARRTLQNLINCGTVGQVLNIKTYVSNPKIQVNKFKYDDANYRVVKFLGLRNKNWMQVKAKKLTEQDFLFPIYLQIVIEYYDIFTKCRYMFMSYTVHKMISLSSSTKLPLTHGKISNNSIKQQKGQLGEQKKIEESMTDPQHKIYQYLESSNKSNLSQLVDLEKYCKFDRENIIVESVASRNLQFKSINMSDRTVQGKQGNSKEEVPMEELLDFSICSSLNELAKLQNRRNLHDDEQYL